MTYKDHQKREWTELRHWEFNWKYPLVPELPSALSSLGLPFTRMVFERWPLPVRSGEKYLFQTNLFEIRQKFKERTEYSIGPKSILTFFIALNFFLLPVLWIRISFNPDPDPAFYPSADPDPDSGSQCNANPSLDPVPGQTSQMLKFYMKNIRTLWR